MPQSKQKTVNYTDGQVTLMAHIYNDALQNHPDIKDPDEARIEAMKEICAMTGKNLHSVRSKLGVMNIYVTKQAKAKTGKKKKTKQQTIDLLQLNSEKREGFFDSAIGARHDVLEYVKGLQIEVDNLKSLLAFNGIDFDNLQDQLDVLMNESDK